MSGAKHSAGVLDTSYTNDTPVATCCTTADLYMETNDSSLIPESKTLYDEVWLRLTEGDKLFSNGRQLYNTAAGDLSSDKEIIKASWMPTFVTFQHKIFGHLTILPQFKDGCDTHDLLADQALSSLLKDLGECGREGSSIGQWQPCRTSNRNMSCVAHTALLNKYKYICNKHLFWSYNDQIEVNTQIASISSALADTHVECGQIDSLYSAILTKVVRRNKLIVSYNHMLKLGILIKHSLQQTSRTPVLKLSSDAEGRPDSVQSVVTTAKSCTILPASPPEVQKVLKPNTTPTPLQITGRLLRARSGKDIMLNFTLGPSVKSSQTINSISITDSRFALIGNEDLEGVSVEQGYNWNCTTYHSTAHEIIKAFNVSFEWLKPRIHIFGLGHDSEEAINAKGWPWPVSERALVESVVNFYQDTLQQLRDNLKPTSTDDMQEIVTQAKQSLQSKGVTLDTYKHAKLIELVSLTVHLSQSMMWQHCSQLLRISSTDSNMRRQYSRDQTEHELDCHHLRHDRVLLIRSLGTHVISKWRRLGLPVTLLLGERATKVKSAYVQEAG